MLCALDGLMGGLLHAAMSSPELAGGAKGLSQLDIVASIGVCAIVLMLAAWCWTWAGAARGDAEAPAVAKRPVRHG